MISGLTVAIIAAVMAGFVAAGYLILRRWDGSREPLHRGDAETLAWVRSLRTGPAWAALALRSRIAVLGALTAAARTKKEVMPSGPVIRQQHSDARHPRLRVAGRPGQPGNNASEPAAAGWAGPGDGAAAPGTRVPGPEGFDLAHVAAHPAAAGSTISPVLPPLPVLHAIIREGLEAAERGETEDLGSFAQYADDPLPVLPPDSLDASCTYQPQRPFTDWLSDNVVMAAIRDGA